MPDFKYDLFISHSKHDARWAEKLKASLRLKGVDPNGIFLDKDNLPPGREWEPIMSNAVVQARILVVFWSQHAKDSDWVPEERVKFKTTMDDEEQRDQHTLRKLIMIPLEEVVKEGQSDPYAKFQSINELKEAGVYQPGVEPNPNPNLWGAVVTKVYNEITADTTHTPINLLILAMTRDRIDLLNYKAKVASKDKKRSMTLATAIKNMGMITDVGLLDRLDPTMDIPNSGTLEDVLKTLKVTTATTPTAPNEPAEIHIQMPNGDSLGEALKKKKIMTVDDLLIWLAQNPGVVLPDGSTFEDALKARNLTTDLESLMIKTALRQYYGSSPANWRPFGSPTDEILTIMSDVQGRYNTSLKTIGSTERPLRWNVLEFNAETAIRVGLERSVIVVDPLSLYDDEVSHQLGSLHNSFDNPKALIMAFAPFMLPTPTSVMRVLLSYKAQRIYDYFFEPEMRAGKLYANCGPDVGDQADIQRWLWQALQPQFSIAQKSSRKHATAFTGAGE